MNHIKHPKEIVDQWIDAVNQVDAQALLSLYDKDAILIPTFSNRILDTRKKHQDYFETLMTREDLSITLHKNTLTIQTLQPTISIVSGIYNWRFQIDGEILNFEARFTYVMDVSKDHPIMHHHSSQIPRML